METSPRSDELLSPQIERSDMESENEAQEQPLQRKRKWDEMSTPISNDLVQDPLLPSPLTADESGQGSLLNDFNNHTSS